MTNWNCKNNAGLRPALFFELTKIDLDNTYNQIEVLNNFFTSSQIIKNSFTKHIYSLIDEFFTPFIIKELNKQKDRIVGRTPKQRYFSFFLTKDLKWQKGAISIENNYYNQLNCIKHLVLSEIDSFQIFLQRLKKDFEEIKLKFKSQYCKIIKIDFSSSDRHNFNGVIIIVTLNNGCKIVYKPKPAYSDNILKELSHIIFNCSDKIYFPLILNKKTYHWEEFICYHKYKTMLNLKTLYFNFGTLLAICDILNYTDGHCENFISSIKKQFVLLDSETIFTNLSYFAKKTTNYFDLEFTGMITPQNKHMPYQPVLRKEYKLAYFPFKPYIEHDNTDNISFNYRQVMKNEADKSFPAYKPIDLNQYTQNIINGLVFGYTTIKNHKKDILNTLRVINIATRQIVRPTIYYSWIIHKYFHPDNKKHGAFLSLNTENLDNKIAEYEKVYIKSGNIPVFYNKLHSRHLYGNNNKIIIKYYFEKTSYYWIKEKLEHLSNDKFITDRIKELKSSLINT